MKLFVPVFGDADGGIARCLTFGDYVLDHHEAPVDLLRVVKPRANRGGRIHRVSRRDSRLTLARPARTLLAMTLRIASLALVLTAAAWATDWSKVPRLPHEVVEDWPQLPEGWNLGECGGVAVDSSDHVWIYNRGPHPVIEVDKHGRFIQAFKEPNHVSAHGIKVDAEGDVWLVDVSGHSVMEFSRAGRLKIVIANPGRSAGNNDSKYAFNRPTGMAFKADGGFYVADGYVNSRIVEFSKDGIYQRHWGSKGKGEGEFDLVHDVTVDRRGRVYVADRTNRRIQVFDAKGKFLAKWTDVGQPWGLAYAAREDAIYMADGDANRIVKLSTDGKILGRLGEFGKTPGKLDFAHHIAVDSEGSIYVTEIKNWRVQKFAKP